jgi:hypothetical protein
MTKLPGTVTVEDVRALAARLRLIPDEYRTFTRDDLQAWRYFKLKRGLGAVLVECGMPHRRTEAGAILLDDIDLQNAMLHINGASAPEASRKFWNAALGRDPALGPSRYRITYYASCPTPDHPGSCRYESALPGEQRSAVEVPGGRLARTAVAQTDVEIRSDWPSLPPAARDWIDATTTGLELTILPYGLRADFDWVRRTGLADCASSAYLLTQEGQRLGLPVRHAFGFIAAPLYATGHHWAEYRVDDVWVPVDPLLMHQFKGWGALPGPDWDDYRYRSPGAVLVSVGDRPRPLVTHDGEDVHATMVTQPRID